MKKFKIIINHFIIIMACLCAMIPYFLITISAFNKSVNIRKGDIFSSIAVQTLIDNYHTLTNSQNFINAMYNTILISVLTVIIGVFLASLAGYAYIIYQNKLMDILFDFSFFSIMIPASALIIPLFMIFRLVGMLDSLFSIVLVSLSLPFLIYLFRQNTKLFPLELIKAARIDGLNEFSIYYKIYLPNMKAVFITASLILFIDTWNSLLYPLIIIQSQSKMTLPVYINSIGSSYTTDYGAFMIALLISTFPILIIFLIVQRYFRAGMKTM